jgi:hypothetical protein
MIRHSTFDIHYSKNAFYSGNLRPSLAKSKADLTEIFKRGFSWFVSFTRGCAPGYKYFAPTEQGKQMEVRISNNERRMMK